MACGDKYTHLLAASGGRTVDEPYSLWCNEPDAQAWYAQASHVKDLEIRAWNALMDIENERQRWPLSRKIRASSDAYEGAFADLPEPSMWMAFGMADCADVVERSIHNIQQGACVLETINDAIASYGTNPIDPGAGGGGKKTEWWKWAVGIGGAAVGLGALSYGVGVLRGKR